MNTEEINLVDDAFYQAGHTDNVEQITELSQHTDERVRWAVAINPNTPTSLLEKLAEDEDLEVREAIAFNKNAPVGILKALAEEGSLTVLHTIASRTDTPSEILSRLAEHSNSYVRGAAIAQLHARGEGDEYEEEDSCS